MLQDAVIVSAHPDDEILWFSSVMEGVDEVIICFLGCGSHPQWGPGRRASLKSHPAKRVTCLDLEEAEVFQGADWERPCETDFGLEISRRDVPDGRYKENFHILSRELERRLQGRANVYTHNPWGEYGNEEHVQIYRVVKALQARMKFNLWYSNYASNVSFRLMMEHISGFASNYVTRTTNQPLGKHMMGVYKEHGVWTWFDDWEWFNEESFMKEQYREERRRGEISENGHIFPINMIKFNYRREGCKESSRGMGIFRSLGGFLGFRG